MKKFFVDGARGLAKKNPKLFFDYGLDSNPETKFLLSLACMNLK